MRTFRIALVAVMLAALAGAPALTQSGQDLFQQALVKEQAEGDLRAAIAIYQRIVRDFSADRTLAAKSLVQMGRCYDRLGQAETSEARKAYERVVREFGDQKEPAEQARALLAAGASARASDTGIAVQLKHVLPAGRRTAMFHVSRDGRYIPFDDGKGGIWLHDLGSGEDRRIVEPQLAAGLWQGRGTSPQVSPDSKQIAYGWIARAEGRLRYELRVADVSGSAVRTLTQGYDSPPLPKAWSPDGKRILILQKNAEGFGHSLVSAADGSVQVLTKRDLISNGCFSPDGRYVVAYRASADGGQFKRITGGLALVPVDGTPPVLLFESAANNWGPFWSPDGRRLVFLSDRSGTIDLWAIRMNGGRPEGEPEVLKREAGSIDPDPIGFTRDGLFYYKTTTYRSDVYTADLDPTTGRVVSKPEQINQQFVGSVGYPMAWSPDGQFLAYGRTSRRELGYPVSKVVGIVVRSEQTGEEREIGSLPTFRERQPFWLFWSQDGRTLLADDLGKELFFHRIDVQTGQRSLLPSGIGSPAWYPVFSPDARTLFYVQYASPERGTSRRPRIMSRGVAGGEARELFGTDEPVELDDLALSRDGRYLAFSISDWNRTPNAFRVMLVPAEGGLPRELWRSEQFITALTWTRDGRHLLAIRSSESGPRQLWSVPVDGGKPELSGLPVHGEPSVPHSVALHPDGRRIAFSSQTGPIEELWVIRNLLSAPNAARK